MTKLGLPVNEGSLGLVSRIQLAELQLVARPRAAPTAPRARRSRPRPVRGRRLGPRRAHRRRLTTPGYMSRQSRRRTSTRRTGCSSTSAPSATSTSSCSTRAATRAPPTGRSRTSRSTSPSRPARPPRTAHHDHDRHRPADPARARHATRCRSSRAPSPRPRRSPARACTSPASATTRRRSTASRSPTRAQPGHHEPAALGRVRHLRRHEPRARRRQHARRRARQRHDERLPAGQPGGRPHVGLQEVHEHPAARRHADRAGRRGRDDVTVSSVTGYGVGDTVNVDTGGEALESRKVTAVGTARGRHRLTLTEPLAARTRRRAVSGSGGDAAGDGGHAAPDRPARAHLRRRHQDTIVTDRDWRTARGPTITDNWYAGTDYDARRVQPGWNEPGADLTRPRGVNGEPTGWSPASIASPPTLDTKLVWREAPPVRVHEDVRPVTVTQPQAGTWVFDLGQNLAGIPPEARRHGPRGHRDQDAPGRDPERQRHGQHRLVRLPGDLQHLHDRRRPGRRDVRAAVRLPRLPVRAGHRPAGDYVPTADTITALQTNADVPAGGTLRPPTSWSTPSTACRSTRSAPTCSRSSPTARTARSSAGSRT